MPSATTAVVASDGRGDRAKTAAAGIVAVTVVDDSVSSTRASPMSRSRCFGSLSRQRRSN